MIAFVWLATYHKGIMRSMEPYETGKRLQFSTVYSAAGDADETVLCSLKDAKGNLWFGNKNGELVAYDVKSRQFSVYTLIIDGNVQYFMGLGIVYGAHGFLWIGTEQGAFCFLNPKKGVCKASAG